MNKELLFKEFNSLSTIVQKELITELKDFEVRKFLTEEFVSSITDREVMKSIIKKNSLLSKYIKNLPDDLRKVIIEYTYRPPFNVKQLYPLSPDELEFLIEKRAVLADDELVGLMTKDQVIRLVQSSYSKFNLQSVRDRFSEEEIMGLLISIKGALYAYENPSIEILMMKLKEEGTSRLYQKEVDRLNLTKEDRKRALQIDGTIAFYLQNLTEDEYFLGLKTELSSKTNFNKDLEDWKDLFQELGENL